MHPVSPQPDSFWAGLGSTEREAIGRIATQRRFTPGVYLCRQGDRSRDVHVVISGYVRVLASASTEREVVVAVRGPGDVIGELAALDAGPRAATLQALDTVETLTMPGQRFATVCQAHSRMAWVLLGVVAGRLRDAGRRWVEFGGGTATRRVAALLLELAVRHGREVGSDLVIAAPATQQELAATAALSRESMARVLRELREHGVVSTGRRRITVHKIAELRRLAR